MTTKQRNGMDRRQELANAIRALIDDLNTGGTLALHDAIVRVREAADAFLTRRVFTETRDDGSTASVREYVFDRSFLNGDGDIVHEPVRAETVKYPDGRVSTSSRNGSPSRLRQVDREMADVLRVETICTQSLMNSAPPDAVEQLKALADRIAPSESVDRLPATQGRRRGRPCVDVAEAERRQKVLEEWGRRRGEVKKTEFVADWNELHRDDRLKDVKELDRILSWNRRRTKSSKRG